jgi:hypothetical protein
MAEIPTLPNSIADMHWADAGAVVEPTPGRKTAGHELYKPRFEHFNWFWRYVCLWLAFFYARVFRTFESVSEALSGDLSNGDLFLVRQSNGTTKQLGAMTHHAWGGTSELLHRTDGLRVYSVFPTQIVVAYDPEDLDPGSRLWEVGPVAHTVSALCAPGSYVYVGYDSGAGHDKVIVLLASTGATFAGPITDAYATPVLNIESDNTDVCYCHGNICEIRDADLTNSRTFDHGAAVRAVAMDADFVYFVGDRGVGGASVGNDLVCLDRATAAHLWSICLCPNPFASPTAVVADGERVFVAGGVDASSRNLWCVDRESAIMWLRVAYSSTVDFLRADDEFLWVARENFMGNSLWLYDKRDGAFRHTVPSTFDHILGIDVDGMGAFAHGTWAASQSVARIDRGALTKEFQQANAYDRSRTPFYKLALPRRHQ